MGIFQKIYRRQLLVTLSVTLLTICHGVGLGWLSPMLPRLQSSIESPVSFVINVDETSWLGSLVSIGGLSGNIFYSALMSRFGRKFVLYMLAIPHMCIWVLIYFAQSVVWLYGSRICLGLTGGGLFASIPIFIGEIADNSVRGRLCSFFNLGINVGILVGYLVASLVPYYVIPCSIIVVPIIYLILVTQFPEPPQQLLRWGQKEEAMESLKFYRNYNDKDALKAKQHMDDIQREFDDLHVAIAKTKDNELNDKLTINDFCNRRAILALITGTMLMVSNIFTGHFAFINYMSSIFAEVHTQWASNADTIVIGIVQILATLAAIYFVDRFGRKPLLLASCGGCGIGTAAFGIYGLGLLGEDAPWLPVLIMSGIIFSTTVGITSISVTILVEILPQKIRAVATSFCLGQMSVFAFISVKIFPLMMEYVGIGATMLMCSGISGACLIYFTLLLEETKGRSMYT